MEARARSCFPVRPVAANRDPCPKAVSGQHSSQALARQLCHLLPRPPSPQQEVRTITEQAAELRHPDQRSEEHTSELQSLMRISYAVFCLKTKNKKTHIKKIHTI